MCMYWILLGLVYLAIIIQHVSEYFTEEVQKFDEEVQKLDEEMMKYFDEETTSVKCKGREVDDTKRCALTDENISKQEQVTT